MKEFDVLRLEINYFLFVVESIFSIADGNLAEDALDSLITAFLFAKDHNSYKDHLQIVENYLSSISIRPEDEYRHIRSNVPNIVCLLGLVQQEIIK